MTAARFAVAPLALACFLWGRRLSRRLAALENLSKLDPLTGLGSGQWLDAERWPAALRSGRPLGVAYLDLDHLKRTNDALGHSVGDQYIRTAAEALSHAVRRGVDEVFRCHQAGDEFEVVLHGPITDLGRCARSLLQRLSDRGVSASLGLAYTTATDFVPERAELRRRAEEACRQAKKQGGGCAMLAGQGLVAASASPPCHDSGTPGRPRAVPPSAQGLIAEPPSPRPHTAEVESL